jgi:hypothetical protein
MSLDESVRIDLRWPLALGVLALIVVCDPLALYLMVAGGMGVGALSTSQGNMFGNVVEASLAAMTVGGPVALGIVGVGLWRKLSLPWFGLAAALAASPVLAFAPLCCVA